MRAPRAVISARASSAAAPSAAIAGSASGPARLPPSSMPPSISGCSRAPGRTTSAPAHAGAPRAGPPTTSASASIAAMSTGSRPAVSPASTAIRAPGAAPPRRGGEGGDVLQRPDVRLAVHQRHQRRVVAQAGRQVARADPTLAVDGHQLELGLVAGRRAAGRQGGGVLHRARHEVAPRSPVPAQQPLHGEVARLDGAGGEDHVLLVGAHQLGQLAAGPLQRLGRPAPPVVEARRAAELLGHERQHRLAHARVERRGRRVIQVGRHPQRPSASRWASSEGRPASRIAFCAAATSYGVRRNSISSASAS